jgi:hypothetical protein
MLQSKKIIERNAGNDRVIFISFLSDTFYLTHANDFLKLMHFPSFFSNQNKIIENSTPIE